jgi:hypothetical protein
MGLGPDSLWSALNVRSEEFFAAFGDTANDFIQRHRLDLERKRWEHVFAADLSPHDFPAEIATYASKTRWVDGTPLYSFHICGLRKLFANAVFIHIVRDVTSVVRSMLNFHRLAGVRFVANEEQAYNKWFHAVSACLLAEQAYGPKVVFRLRYLDLVNRPEATMEALLNFLGEPYATECLTPLEEKINSSNVPADFELGDPTSDPAIVNRALRLHAEIETTPQASEPSRAAANEMETAFYQQAHGRAQRLAKAQARAERLAGEIKRKRAFIKELRASRWRHKLRRLLFGHRVILALATVFDPDSVTSCAAYFLVAT